MKMAICMSISSAFALVAHGADMNASCPAALTGDDVTVRAPLGWKGSAQPVIRLVAAGMMAGPPESHADLVPYKQRRLKNGAETTWVFDGGEKWYVCTYGSYAIQLARRLDDSATQCTVRHTSAGLPAVTSAAVECTTKKWQ